MNPIYYRTAFCLLCLVSTIHAQMSFVSSSVDNVCAQGRTFADIDMDGYIDVIVAEGEFACGAFAWYKYPNWDKYPINDDAFADLDYVPDSKAADIDGDGDTDILIPNSRNGGKKVIYWFENPKVNPVGDGNPRTEPFTRHTVWEANDDHIKDVALSDLDKDGSVDIVARFNTKARIFFQDSLDSWSGISVPIIGSEGMDVGDIDGDGFDDVVCNGVWLRNPGKRGENWVSRSIAARGSTCRVLVCDVDGDGIKDPVFSNSEGAGNVAWFSASDRILGPWVAHEIVSSFSYCHTLRGGDMDGDGDMDILAGQMPQASNPKLIVYINNKGVGTSWGAHLVAARSSYIGKIADLGADNDLDIIVRAIAL